MSETNGSRVAAMGARKHTRKPQKAAEQATPLSRHNKHYLPEERQFIIDTYATHTAQQVAHLLGRTASSVTTQRQRLRGRGVFVPSTLRTGGPIAPVVSNQAWDMAESLLSGGTTIARTAQLVGLGKDKLRRLLHATERSIKQLRGIFVYSRYGVARLFGVAGSTAIRWDNEGYLSTHRLGHKRKHFCYAEDIEAFMQRSEAWPTWEPQRITDEAWRGLALEIRPPDGPRWINAPEAARIIHYSQSWLFKCVAAGRIPAKRMGSFLWIWSEDLDRFWYAQTGRHLFAYCEECVL